MRTVLSSDDVSRALRRLAHEIIEANHGAENLVLIGIRTRGVPLARRLAELIGEFEDVEIPYGSIDVTLYRDDLSSRGPLPIGETSLPVDLAGRTVVLVDDVLFTGRTIRAALDALLEFGRPEAIRLVVLVDRGHRELPIRADHVGKNLPTALAERIDVRLEEIDGADEVVLLQDDDEEVGT